MSNIALQRMFVNFKLLTLIHFSKVDLQTLGLRTEGRELQMDSLLMRVEEVLEVNINPYEINIFKKEFDNFFLVPAKQLEGKLAERQEQLEISLLMLMNKILKEWDKYQDDQRKKLLRKFIDFDENGDGVLTLEEFRELLKNVEGSTVP